MKDVKDMDDIAGLGDDEERVEEVDMNRSITIIRKDRTSTDPPMLLEGVVHSLLMSDKLQYFFVENHSLNRQHHTLTSHGQELLFYNCILTKKKDSHIVYSYQYCLIEGQTSNERNLIFLGVCSNKSKPFTVQCYIYNMERSLLVRIQPSKVCIVLLCNVSYIIE